MKSQINTLKDGYEAPAITSFVMSSEAGFCLSGVENQKFIIDTWMWDDEPENE